MRVRNNIAATYQEKLRIVSEDFPDTWILINVDSFQSLSMNDEQRIKTLWAKQSSWTHLAHDGVLYERT